MGYDLNREIDEALLAADRAIALLENSLEYLNSASNWGAIDLLGGGMISTFAKHSKYDNAKREIEKAKYAVYELNRELGDISSTININIDINDLLTFADFFFDGFFADVLVQSKIYDAKQKVKNAINQISTIKATLMMYK